MFDWLFKRDIPNPNPHDTYHSTGNIGSIIEANSKPEYKIIPIESKVMLKTADVKVLFPNGQEKTFVIQDEIINSTHFFPDEVHRLDTPFTYQEVVMKASMLNSNPVFAISNEGERINLNNVLTWKPTFRPDTEVTIKQFKYEIR